MSIWEVRGRTWASSWRSGVDFVQPVVIRRAVFCVVCSLFMRVFAVSGCHAVCAYVSSYGSDELFVYWCNVFLGRHRAVLLHCPHTQQYRITHDIHSLEHLWTRPVEVSRLTKQGEERSTSHSHRMWTNPLMYNIKDLGWKQSPAIRLKIVSQTDGIDFGM